MSAENKEQVTLVTSDEESFKVEKKVAERSQLIKSMMEGKFVLSERDALWGDWAGWGVMRWRRAVVSSSDVCLRAERRALVATYLFEWSRRGREGAQAPSLPSSTFDASPNGFSTG
jgi:hypothetical protein